MQTEFSSREEIASERISTRFTTKSSPAMESIGTLSPRNSTRQMSGPLYLEMESLWRFQTIRARALGRLTALSMVSIGRIAARCIARETSKHLVASRLGMVDL